MMIAKERCERRTGNTASKLNVRGNPGRPDLQLCFARMARGFVSASLELRSEQSAASREN